MPRSRSPRRPPLHPPRCRARQRSLGSPATRPPSFSIPADHGPDRRARMSSPSGEYGSTFWKLRNASRESRVSGLQAPPWQSTSPRVRTTYIRDLEGGHTSSHEAGITVPVNQVERVASPDCAVTPVAPTDSAAMTSIARNPARLPMPIPSSLAPLATSRGGPGPTLPRMVAAPRASSTRSATSWRTSTARTSRRSGWHPRRRPARPPRG